MAKQLAVGLMSGTSMDGIDAALIETDGKSHVRPLAFHHMPYDDGFRAALRAGMAAARTVAAPRPEAESFAALARELTRRHADAVKALLAGGRADIIGFHGQTLVHRPEQRWTWQIGDGPLLARLTGLDVVHDFRSADVAAGGHGAPLLPVYHAARAGALPKPVAVLNLGGVGNITYVGDDLLAFDTGPANALIDDWMHANSGQAYDADGATAARGRVNEAILAQLCDKDWFDLPPPKSLDRHDFSLDACHGLSLADGAATLTAFTAETVRLAARFLPQPPQQWIVCGGGRLNATLMQMLQQRLPGMVQSADDLDWNGDSVEAEGFAYMAVRHLRGLPISFPGTTGAPVPMTGGVLQRFP